MNQVYLAEFIQYLCLIPAAAICFLPMKNQLKYSAKTTAGIAAGGIISLSLAGIFSNLSLGVNGDLVFFAAIIMCFVFYYRMVKCGLGEKLAIFFLAIALSSFMSDYASYFLPAIISFSQGITVICISVICFSCICLC